MIQPYLHSVWSEILLKLTNDKYLINSLFNELISNYSQKNRYYHNLKHIEIMLKYADNYKDTNINYERLFFAICYHDVIYNPYKHDNEEQSADFAKIHLELVGIESSLILKISKMILRTKEHALFDTQDDSETCLLLDFDLAILGSDEANYAAYSKQIRQEYKFVPLFVYKKKRINVLNNFLNQPQIYRTDYFIHNFEDKARRNIQSEIERLKGKRL